MSEHILLRKNINADEGPFLFFLDNEHSFKKLHDLSGSRRNANMQESAKKDHPYFFAKTAKNAGFPET